MIGGVKVKVYGSYRMPYGWMVVGINLLVRDSPDYAEYGVHLTWPVQWRDAADSVERRGSEQWNRTTEQQY